MFLFQEDHDEEATITSSLTNTYLEKEREWKKTRSRINSIVRYLLQTKNTNKIKKIFNTSMDSTY